MSSFSTVQIEGTVAAPDRIYYNGTVINNNFSTVKQEDDPPLRFQDQRQNPLVPDASNYEVAVQNFSLNGCSKSLPLFIPQINPKDVTVEITQIISTRVPIPTLPGNPQQYGPYCKVEYFTTTPTGLFIGATIDSVLSTPFDSNYDFPSQTVKTPQKIIAVTAYSFTLQFATNPGTWTGPGLAIATYKDPTDVTTTIYNVSVGIYNASGPTYTIVTEPIIWVSENRAKYTYVPSTSLPVQAESDYYYCYTYSHWISLVNIALTKAWKLARVAPLGGSTAGTQCPFMEFDELSGLFSINQDANTCMTPYGTSLPPPYGVASSATSPSGTYTTGEYSFVGWNTCLDNLFSNIPSIYYSVGQEWATQPLILLPENVIDTGLTINLITGAQETIDYPTGLSLKTKPSLSSFQLTNPFTDDVIPNAFFVRLTEDFKSTGGTWSPIASFVLATTQIPVRNEASANPVTFGTANIGSGSANSGSFQKVLVEVPINATTADIWKGWVLYEPLIETYSSLDPSHDGVQDVDVNLFWRNRLTNSLIPVRVPNQSSMTFRLLFKRKLVKELYFKKSG